MIPLHGVVQPPHVLQMKVSQWLCGYLKYTLSGGVDAFSLCWVGVLWWAEIIREVGGEFPGDGVLNMARGPVLSFDSGITV